MARPVVPIRVRRGVVRVDVARAIVAAIVHVPTAANGTHHVGINEVGVRSKIPTKMHCSPKLWMIIAGLSLLCLFLEENYGLRMKKLSFCVGRCRGREEKGPAVPSAACAAFTPTGRRKGPTRRTNARTKGRRTRRRSAGQRSGQRSRTHGGERHAPRRN